MPGAIIHTVTHTVVNGSGDGLWRIILPAAVTGLIGAIVPTVAVIFTFLQSRESNRLAREQLKASSLIAERQVTAAERQVIVEENKLKHDTFDVRYAAWQEMRAAANLLYSEVASRGEVGTLNASAVWAAVRTVDNARLKMKMVFGEEVSFVADKIKVLLQRWRQEHRALVLARSKDQDTSRLEGQALKTEIELDEAIEQLLTDVVARHMAPIPNGAPFSNRPEAPVPHRAVENP